MLFYQPFFSPAAAWTIAIIPVVIAFFMRGRRAGGRILLALSGIATVFFIEFANLLDVPVFAAMFMIALLLPIAALWVVNGGRRRHL